MSVPSDQPPGRLHRAQGLAGRAYSAANGWYSSVLRPDRPIEPEPGKRPWLAGLLSLVVVGAGQLYNRQLIKALLLFVIFYPLGLILAVLYLLFDWWLDVTTQVPELSYAYAIIWGGLWLFAVVDAYRIALALKTGKLVIRYGFLRQGAHAAAGFIPFAGVLAPAETAKLEEAHPELGKDLKTIARDRVLEWVVVRFLRYGLLVVGLLLIILGLIIGVRPLITVGGLVILAAILLFLA